MPDPSLDEFAEGNHVGGRLSGKTRAPLQSLKAIDQVTDHLFAPSVYVENVGRTGVQRLWPNGTER